MTKRTSTFSATQPKYDRNTETRIGRNITPQPNGCWIYGTNPESYRTDHAVGRHGGRGMVHRFVYETLVGPIPDGLELHHKCQTKACCNPEHLEPLTRSEHKAVHGKLKQAS